MGKSRRNNGTRLKQVRGSGRKDFQEDAIDRKLDVSERVGVN